MIKKLEIDGIHSKTDAKLHDYVMKKIGSLDRYISRHARESAHAEVKLKEAKIKAKKECTCEAIIYLPHDVLRVQETTLNMFAAVDIVEAKLKNQLKKYKEMHNPLKLHRRVLARFKRSAAIQK